LPRPRDDLDDLVQFDVVSLISSTPISSSNSGNRALQLVNLGTNYKFGREW
jgi:hypothetical protein